MYTIHVIDEASETPRFRAPARFPEVAVSTVAGGRIAGAVSLADGGAASVTFKGDATGFWAWSPPV